MTDPSSQSPAIVPERIAHYRVVREIGRGGMGIVYEALDEKLQRAIALKAILPTTDPHVRDRFLREARAAAAVSHPHICQLFEIGEHEGQPFLAMELLEGRSLADRLNEGALPAPEAIATALSILSALEALHRRGLVHRDLKPSNIFITPHGVKLLDFGLARPVTLDGDTTSLTLPGVVLGTPRYMAPEQARGYDVDARTDLFAAGAVLFEMLTGKPAFNGPSALDVMHAVTHENPPALVGSPGIVEADRVIQRALAKVPADRYQSAEEMAGELRACLSYGDPGGTAIARATTRLVVLPFRLLRPDADLEFLVFSLPDAITIALSGLESLVVRSSLTAGRLAEGPDLLARARELNADTVVTGTLLSAGGLIRVSVQVIDVAGGTVLWSHALQVPVDDLFQVQDAVASAVVEALALPLSNREQRLLRRDVPTSAEAYALYLRANRLSQSSAEWPLARDHYLRAVEADPAYAPAWARLGRVLRIIGKYSIEPDAPRLLAEAEAAFQRAFELNPDLSLAHNLYTYAEVDSGRALDAVLRLLNRLQQRTSDPELYAGLVHACRYVGLLEASFSANQRARRLDPAIRTSVAHCYFMNGEYKRAIEFDVEDPPYVSILSLLSMGRSEEALAKCKAATGRTPQNAQLGVILDALAAGVGGEYDRGRAALEQLLKLPGFSDPEGWYYWALAAVLLRDETLALELVQRSVRTGLHCVRALESSPHFDPLRLKPEFIEAVELARAGQSAGARAFADADGPRLLGLATF